MFGHASQPSRIYSYRVKEIVANAEIIEEQMRLAHRYRNDLVRLELDRRAKTDEALRALSPRLVETEEAIAHEEPALEEARNKIKRVSAEARKKVRPRDLVANIAEIKARLKDLRAERKRLRTDLFESEEWEKSQFRINEWENAEKKHLRAGCGLYWSTYLHVEQSASSFRRGAPPKFFRFDGSGHLAVQIQCGMSVAKALECGDSQVRVDFCPDGVWREGKRRPRKVGNCVVDFRVGSEPNGAPIFARLGVVLHRPLPADSRIKWVHLIRERLGTKTRWHVQFVLARESEWDKPDRAKSGMVGIDVGWRVMPDRSLRVAYAFGDDEHETELALPPEWMAEMGKTRHIRSIRDRDFNEAKDRFAASLGAAVVPDWMREATATLGQWRSCARLAALAIRWRGERFDGDEAMFAPIEAWRKRDKHLYEYEAHLRDQLQARRRDIYRSFAATIRRRYRMAVLEDLDLREFHELPEVELELVRMDGALREHPRDACLSALLQCLTESMAEILYVPAPYTTTTCTECGHVGASTPLLMRTCEQCGHVEDQDRAAARNLLRLGMARIASAAAV